MTCICLCIVNYGMSNLNASKLKLSTPMTWDRILESTLPFKILSCNPWKTAQVSKMLCYDALWQSNNLGIILCHQSFLQHCLSSTCWKLFPFLESIWFLNIEHLITLVNWNAASRDLLITFFALMVLPKTNWRTWPWQYVKWTQSRLCMLLL